MAEHIDVQSVFGVFVVESGFGEVASGFVGGASVLPISKAEVGGDFVPFSDVEEKMGLVHSEIADLVI